MSRSKSTWERGSSSAKGKKGHDWVSINTATRQVDLFRYPPMASDHFVLIYGACHFQANEAQSHVPMVRRPAGKMYGGMLNLPGGRVESEDESSKEAALREWREETGIDCRFPQLMGYILPLPKWIDYDKNSGETPITRARYRVDCYSAIYSGGERFNPENDQPVELVKLDRMGERDDLVPNVAFVVAFCRLRLNGWILTEPFWTEQEDGRTKYKPGSLSDTSHNIVSDYGSILLHRQGVQVGIGDGKMQRFET